MISKSIDCYHDHDSFDDDESLVVGTMLEEAKKYQLVHGWLVAQNKDSFVHVVVRVMDDDDLLLYHPTDPWYMMMMTRIEE